METGNQREGYGRSRGKWSRKKEREKQKEQQREHLDLLNPEKETSEKQEEKNAGRKIAVAVGGAVLTAAVAAGAVYVGMGQKYKRVYFPNTTINGLDVSGLTPDEVKKQITDETSGYTMIVQERGGETKPSGAATLICIRNLMEHWRKSWRIRVRLHGAFISAVMWIIPLIPWRFLMMQSFRQWFPG